MAKSAANGKKRPKLVPAPEDKRRISALLAQELSGWPDVSQRPMFGLRAFYRNAVVFAMLPDKRALERPGAIAYKLRSVVKSKKSRQWKLFDLDGEHDIDAALACLDRAYGEAGGAGT